MITVKPRALEELERALRQAEAAASGTGDQRYVVAYTHLETALHAFLDDGLRRRLREHAAKGAA